MKQIWKYNWAYKMAAQGNTAPLYLFMIAVVPWYILIMIGGMITEAFSAVKKVAIYVGTDFLYQLKVIKSYQYSTNAKRGS